MDDNKHIYKLLYISSNVNDVSTLTLYKSDPEFVIDNILSNTEAENIKYIQTFFKQDMFGELYNLLIKHKYDEIIQYNEDKCDELVINYFKAVSYYNMQNYKQCIYFCNKYKIKCNNSVEISYMLSKIYYDNNEYNKSLTEIEDYVENKPKLNTIISNVDIYQTKLYNLFILILIKLSFTDRCIKYINLLIEYNIITPNLFSILSSIMDVNCSKKYNSNYVLNDNILSYQNNENYFNYKDIIYKSTLGENCSNITNTKSENKYTIPLPNNNRGAYLNYNNKALLYITSLSPQLVINNIDLEKGSIKAFMRHSTNSYLANYKLVSNFVEYKSIYISLVMHNNSNCNLFKIICLNKNTLEPIKLSKFIKLNFTSIKDIFIANDELNIIINNTSSTLWYSLSMESLYLDLNLPIDYSNNINIDIVPLTLSINIKNNLLLDLDIDKQFESYELTDNNPDCFIDIDFENNIISNNNYDKLITTFIYKYTDISILDKEFTLSFYDKNKNEDLYTKMVDLKISISESYSNSKYFIIDACDLNKMSSLQVSNIINNNTLIINLLNENDIKYKNMIYMEDEHINKLFLFNIMKNSDYKSFIYERIIKDDQYNQRVDFMEIDKTNMIKSCGIVKHIKEFINKKNKYDELYQSDYNKFPYKLTLITDLHKKTDNLMLIEILRYILYNNQSVNIIYNINIDELIFRLNILGNTLRLDQITDKIQPGKFLLILDSIQTLKSVKFLCDEDSLIYIADKNKLLFIK